MALDYLLRRVNRIESSKEPEPVPPTSDVGEMLALALHLLLLTLLQLYHLPPLSLLQLVILLACSLVADPVCQMLPCTMVVFKVVYYEIKNVYFLFVFM